jgi:hypothetical protein
MAEPFKGRPEQFADHRARRLAKPAKSTAANVSPRGSRMCRHRQTMDRRSRQAPQRATTEQFGRITERLASRVKGLTAVFQVLLLTTPRRIDHLAGLCDVRQKAF